MSSKERLHFFAGLLVGGFGLFIGFGAILNMIEKSSESSLAGDIVGFMVLGLAPLIGGIWICARAKNKSLLRQKDHLEDELLKLARKNSGLLTIEEVAMNTRLTLDEARKVLEQFASEGYVELEITDTGVLVYKFPGVSNP